jgi:hypothetical protein
MRRVLVFICILLFLSTLFGEEIFNLDKTNKPSSIIVSGDSLIVADRDTVQKYSIEKKRFINYIGNCGDGPEEFAQYPTISMDPNENLIIYSFFGNKLLHFSDKGSFTKEIKFPRRIRGRWGTGSYSFTFCDKRFFMRKVRITYEGAIQHAMSRGYNGLPIFKSDVEKNGEYANFYRKRNIMN